ncbi:MAG: hypothetical protein AB7F96_07710 [Beijerinckiaceae bacterium]
MTLVFAGACSHAPGITGRAERADPNVRDAFYSQFHRMAAAIRQSGAEALVVIAAEHFANLFKNNMPSYIIGMADYYTGPIEDEQWLGIKKARVPGNAALSKRLIEAVMQDVDVSFAEEMQFDHGVSVPLHFLTPAYDMNVIPIIINCQAPPLSPLHRAYAFGRALRKAIDAAPEKIAVVCTGGISHWPATPDSGKINEEFDREFLERFLANDHEALTSYSDAEIYDRAGQGGFEIRTYVALAGLCEGAKGDLWFYAPIPIFAVGCTIAAMDVRPVAASGASA